MNARAVSAESDSVWPPEPIANPGLVGHRDAEATLQKAFAGPRMAHAWLISGPRGVGKATLAYRFARYALAQGVPGEQRPGLFGGELLSPSGSDGLWTDPASAVFQRVAAGGHADLMVIRRSLNKQGKLRGEIVIEDVRGIGAFMSLTAAEGGWRIVVIDSVDEMNRNAANAVLKVLEEPPARAMLLLISHNPGRLLPTIRSRCRKLTVSGLPDTVINDLLTQYLPSVGGDDRAALAKLSEGSIGQAIELSGAGGLGLYRDILQLLLTCPGLDIPLLHKLAGNWSRTGAEDTFARATEILVDLLGRMVRELAANRGGNGLTSGEMEVFERFSGTVDLDRWLEVWEKINDLLDRTSAINLDRKQVILNIFLEIDGAARSGLR